MKTLLSVFLLVAAFSQTTVPVNPTTVTIPAGTFEQPINVLPPLARSGNTVSCPTCGGSSTGGGTIGPPSQVVTNLYVSAAGSDSNSCNSANPCKTLGHTLSLVPAQLAQPYQINVGDGVYAEPIDGRGYSGSTISIVGDTANPGNVTFAGTVTNCDSPRFSGFTTVVCLQGRGTRWYLSGLSTSGTARNSVTCDDCSAMLSNMNVTGSFVTGILNESGYLNLQGTINISGFSSGDLTNSAFGIYNGWGGHILQNDGVLTITGSGWANGLLSYGIVEEFQSSWTQMTICDTCSRNINLYISNVRYGISITSHSSFASFVSNGTITMNNPSVSPGNGIDMYNASEFDLEGGSTGLNLSINNFAYCLSGYGLTEMSHGPGNRSFTNCGINQQQGSVFTLF